MRIGLGVDVHPIAVAKPCFIGGIVIDEEFGCVGHSDGDVIAHALCDALLSAVGIGDLGSVFGTDQLQWEDASGLTLLREVMVLVQEKNFAITNAVVQFIGNTPRIDRYRSEMEAALSQVCTAPITVTGTTTDGLGLIGRGEGRAAIATALLHSMGD